MTLATEVQNKDKYIPEFNDSDDFEEDPDFLLFGWLQEPKGGMNDFLGDYLSIEEAKVNAILLAESMEISQYQIVHGVSLDIIEEGSLKDLVPTMIN